MPRKNSTRPARPDRALPLLFLVSLLLITLPACRHTENRLPGYLYLRLVSDPTTLDPALITDVAGGSIAAKLFNGLVRFSDDLTIAPDVAQSWKLADDQVTYTFRLRPDVTFSNGKRLTARDVKFSFERVLMPETKAPRTWVLDRIEGAHAMLSGRAKSLSGLRVLDDHTLVIKLKQPFGPFLSLLAMTAASIVPQEVVLQRGPDFGSHPVGSGPFVLQNWRHDQDIVLASRADYFAGRAKLNGIFYRVIPEDLTAVLEFETDGLDALLIPSSEYRRYTTDPAWRNRVLKQAGLNTYYLGMNCAKPPFNDIRVRRAMNYAVDRQRIFNTLFEKRGQLANGPIPPALWKREAPSPETTPGYRYDPERARKLLRDAGAAGAHFKIYISADAEVLDIVEVIQNELAAVGLKAEIVQLDWSAFKRAVNDGQAEAFWLSWWADYPDPENFLYPLFHSESLGPAGNKSRCVDRELDRLINTAQRTMNETRRYHLYREADARVTADAPWVFMWHRADYYVVQPRVRNFKIYPLYSMEKRTEVSVTQ